MTGTPPTSKQTLWTASFRIRVPLPAARMTETIVWSINGVISSPSPCPPRSQTVAQDVFSRCEGAIATDQEEPPGSSARLGVRELAARLAAEGPRYSATE